MVPMILHSLALTPTTLKRMLREVRTESYADRLTDERFTLTEMIAHVADLEDVFLNLMRRAQEYPGSESEGLDIDGRAAEHRYAEKDPHHEIEVFANRRRDTLDFLGGLPTEDWNKTVRIPNLGEASIAQLVAGLMAHDLYHLEQTSQYMA